MNFKKYLAIFITVLGFSYFLAQEASANTINSNEDLISKVEIYDEDNNLIPYSPEELKELIKFETNNSPLQNNNLVTPYAVQRTYNSGAFDFINYIYINGGKSFKNPLDIQITPKGEAKDFTLTISGTTGGGQSIKFPGGWSGTVHYSLSNYANGNYTFQFTNDHWSRNFIDNVKVIYTY